MKIQTQPKIQRRFHKSQIVYMVVVTGTKIKFRSSVVVKKCRHFLNPRRKYFHNFKCGAKKKWGNLKITKNEQNQRPSIFYQANS